MTLPYRPNPLTYPVSPSTLDGLNATIDNIYDELRRVSTALAALGTGGSGPHDILSSTHTDTTAAAVVNGDLIAGIAAAWARLPVGTNKQVLEVVTGAPAWSNDGSGLEDLNATEIVGTIPTASYVHSMLSAAHQDSDPASGILGDMIVAQSGTAVDAQANWIDGEALDVLPASGDPGAGDYWIDGDAWGALVSTGTVLWKRKAVGTAGYVWTAAVTGPEWQASGSALGASSSASVYRSSDFTLADVTPTAVIHSATTFDDGGYWAAGTPTRLTVPTGQGGTYVVTGTFALDAGYAGISFAHLYVNGVKKATGPGGGKTVTAPYTDPASCTAIIKLNSGDYVELYAEIRNNVVGAGFTVKGGATATFLEVGRLVSESTVSTELPSVVAGSLIRGNSAGSQWERVAIGAADTVLLSSGTLPDWSTRPTLRDVAEAVSGVWDFSNGLKERGRTPKIGEWTSVAYAAGDFTASGAMTWTVDAGDVTSFVYALVGDTLFVIVGLATTSIAGVVSNQVFVKIPGGFTAQSQPVVRARFLDAGVEEPNAIAFPQLAGTNMVMQRAAGTNFTAAVNNTTVQFSMFFKVS